MPQSHWHKYFLFAQQLGFSQEMDKLAFCYQNYISCSSLRKCEPWKCFPYNLASLQLALSSFRVTLYQIVLFFFFLGFFQGRDLHLFQVTEEKHILFKLSPLTHMALRQAIDFSRSLIPTRMRYYCQKPGTFPWQQQLLTNKQVINEG